MKTGKIIVLAFPDTYVTVTDEWLCKFLPLVGLGTKEFIKAGHAALILVENKTGNAAYYDFGRYVTPDGLGRVRGANTDAELTLPFKAQINKDRIENLSDFLLWLDANPDKTHGEGRLLASVCADIDFNLAETYIKNLQNQGSVSYGAFQKNGSNCARFVTETILSATNNKAIIKALKWNKKFTPSTVGNVEKSSAYKVFEVSDGKINTFNGSALKENLKNYFHKKRTIVEKVKVKDLPETSQLLAGIGSNAWFEIVKEELPLNHFRIRRYNDWHQMDFDGVYIASEGFDSNKKYQFAYDSNCEYCHILQNDKKIKFNRIASYSNFNLMQKVHSA